MGLSRRSRWEEPITTTSKAFQRPFADGKSSVRRIFRIRDMREGNFKIKLREAEGYVLVAFLKYFCPDNGAKNSRRVLRAGNYYLEYYG